MSNTQAAPHIFPLQIRSVNLRYLATFLLFTATLAFAQTTPIVQNDFEDGTLQGWIPRGTAILSNTTEAAHGGTHSLKTTGRTAGFNGPSLNLVTTLSMGNVYQITAWVRLVTGQTADQLKITVQRTPAGGSNAFDQVTPLTNVTDSGWVMLQGQYSFTTDVSGLLLYIEAADATTQYYVDDFSIIKVPAQGCAVPQDNSGIHTDFETGTAQGWRPRIGRETVTVTSADAHGGTYSLLTTGRQRTFDGPSINAAGKLCNGSRYKITVWVKMAPGQPDTQIRLSLQRSLAGQTNFNTVIPNTVVTANAWVRLKATYDFAFNYDSLSLYVESNNNPNASFYIDDFDVTFVQSPVIEDIPSIAQTYSSDFLVGFATLQQDIVGSHGQLAALHYNSVTPGNDLKWDTTERTEGNFNFGPGDNILAFAQSHNIKMRGHTFVWHNQVPAWVFQNGNVDMSTQPFSNDNKKLLLSRLQNHIKNLIDHYQAKIYVWDVVNEAIDESQPDGFRRSKWYAITVDPNNNPGYPEYMDDAFIYADEELKALGIRDNVKLCYNDFNTTISSKRNFIFNWVKGAISRGVPIDCVGHQFHNTINFPINDQGSDATKQNVIDTINLFSSLTSTAGVPIINEVTEFDISVYRFGQCSQTFYTDYDDLIAGDQKDLINQGYRYRDYFQIFKNLKDKIDSVTIWGLGDDDSWLNPSSGKAGCGVTANDAPLPFDANLQHKFAYTGIVDPLALPGANLVTTMTADSSTVLSGHPVSYLISVTNKGPNDAANLTLTTSIPASSVFQSIVPPAGWTCSTPAIGSAGQVTCTAQTLSNGGSVQFTLTESVVCATPDGTSIANSAAVTSTTLDPNPNPQNSASVSITVSNPPPVISDLAVTPSVIWPPNHKMVDAMLTYNITDNCDAGLVPTIAITSNESANGAGDGNTSTDWQVIDAQHVQIRAERSGTGTGRVYTITLTATDSAGSSTSNSTTVTVPHDQ